MKSIHQVTLELEQRILYVAHNIAGLRVKVATETDDKYLTMYIQQLRDFETEYAILSKELKVNK